MGRTACTWFRKKDSEINFKQLFREKIILLMSRKWTIRRRSMEQEYLVLTKDEAFDILSGDSDYKSILEEFMGKSRWSLHYRLVFEKEGKFYETSYSRGATESQDE